ncbi:MAG: glycosyltransferase family 4 protein [Acidimicrobiales bacterium]
MDERTRPSRIDQVLPSIVERDAVSHHTIEAQRILRQLGFVSEIYAVNMGPEMAGRVHLIADLPRVEGGSQWVCYQGSIGSPAADAFAAHPGPKLLNYHNITPANLVEAWMPSLGDEVRLGRTQLGALAKDVSFGIADSAYNASELEAWGYSHTTVSMLMVDHANFDVTPDARRRASLAQAKQNGGADWLFVGQMLPHKAHQDVVKGFAAYLRAYDPLARLHLAGRDSCPPYALAVRRYVESLGISSSVDFAGSVTSAELVALYETADVYVSCSNHEGFCAPLLEAMHHGVPIVAFSAAAVPETVGDAGVILPSKEPALVAAAAERVLSDSSLREHLVSLGHCRAQLFTPARARAQFESAVAMALELVPRS